MQNKNIALSSLGSVGNISVITNAGTNNHTSNQSINQGNVSFRHTITPDVQQSVRPEAADVSININGSSGNICVIENGGNNNHQSNGSVSQGDVCFEHIQTLPKPEEIMLQQKQRCA